MKKLIQIIFVSLFVLGCTPEEEENFCEYLEFASIYEQMFQQYVSDPNETNCLNLKNAALDLIAAYEFCDISDPNIQQIIEHSHLTCEENENPSAEYDFYTTDYNRFLKNNQIVYGAIEKEVSKLKTFIVTENSVYQGADKKFRNTGVDDLDYGGLILKDGNILYGDTGEGTTINGIAVNGENVYYVSAPHSNDYYTSIGFPCKLWKNGVAQYSLNGPFNNYGRAEEVYIVGNDVYVSGVEVGYNISPYNSIEVSYGYWKNGNYVEVYRGGDYAVISNYLQFKVTSNGDTYLKVTSDTGFNGNNSDFSSKIFKNGIEMTFSANGRVIFNDFVVSGNDVYAVGSDIDANNNSTKAVWKNGIPYYIEDPNDNYKANNIDVKDGRVFLGTDYFYKIEIWEFHLNTRTFSQISETVDYGHRLHQLFVK